MSLKFFFLTILQDIIAVGVTNQRETTIVWDRNTGKPLHNAIVWLDMRTSSTIDKLLDTVPNKTRNKNYLKVKFILSFIQCYSNIFRTAIKCLFMFYHYNNYDSISTISPYLVANDIQMFSFLQ